MRMDKSTAATISSIKLPGERGSPLTLTGISSVLEIQATSTFDIIIAPMDEPVLEGEKKHSRAIQLAGSSKSLSPAFIPAA